MNGEVIEAGGHTSLAAARTDVGLTLLGDDPGLWDNVLQRNTVRTGTTLHILDGTPLDGQPDSVDGVLQALRLRALATQWELGDAFLELMRLHPSTYQQLLDPEHVDSQNWANMRSICRWVPDTWGGLQLRHVSSPGFWSYNALVPLFRQAGHPDTWADAADPPAPFLAAVGIIMLARDGGWTQAQVREAAAMAKRMLENKNPGRLLAKLESWKRDESGAPLPPTSTKPVPPAPRPEVPGTKQLNKALQALVLGATDDAGQAAVRGALTPTSWLRVAQAVTMWLQTEAPADFIDSILQGRLAAHQDAPASAGTQLALEGGDAA